MIIELNDIEGYPCLVRADAIIYAIVVKRQGNKLATHVSFGMPDSFVIVSDTPAELAEKIAAASAEYEVVWEEDDEEEIDETGC